MSPIKLRLSMNRNLAFLIGVSTLFFTVILSPVFEAEAYRVRAPAVAAAGDIACDPDDPNYNGGLGSDTRCRMKYTSDLLVRMKLAAVLTLGDNQYEDGALNKFQQSYDTTWGRVKPITRPSIGNHEYGTPDGAGYFSYFGAAAGDPSKGYYSFSIGTWHIVALNSNCDEVGGCGSGSPQELWLKADLAAHRAFCTLAYWHHPRFSSGPHGNNVEYDAWWRDLYEAGVEVVLNGHDHVYERFAPQDPVGVSDIKFGIREFVVGTGGKSHYSFGSIQPNSEVRNSETFGVLKLKLYPTRYDWHFTSELGGNFTDSGTGMCHKSPTPRSETGQIEIDYDWIDRFRSAQWVAYPLPAPSISSGIPSRSAERSYLPTTPRRQGM